MTHILITGGAGFIGSHFVRYVRSRRPDWHITVLDKLTYAGNPANLAEHEGTPGYRFLQGDICRETDVHAALALDVDLVVNFAADTHVDRSISSPRAFLDTDILGTFVLLTAAREHSVKRFLHISTDEVYGSIAAGSATEQSPLNPTNPYSASKASGDLIALSFYKTYGFPVVITRSSNNYGSHQYPEKFLPLFITNALESQPLPLYGKGDQVRDWLHADDNCAGILLALEKGVPGEVYNIGGRQERQNIDMAKRVIELTGADPSLLRFVTDRPAHDFRYSVDSSKITALGWQPQIPLEQGLQDTVRWYRENPGWWQPLKSGEFREYYRRHYETRLKGEA
jgi:dTDP-glucose 4,6-dehydratase